MGSTGGRHHVRRLRGRDVQREIRLEFDVRNRRGVPELNDDEATAFAAGEAALGRTVDFMLRAGVPHVTLLPYRYLLVVLTRVFAHRPEPDPVNGRLLGTARTRNLQGQLDRDDANPQRARPSRRSDHVGA